MSDRQKRSPRLRFLFAAGVSGIALAVCSGHSGGQTSEIDSYDAAVTSQSKAEALSFITNFGSSHLVGDLIASLRPEVAQQVCADLQGGGPAKARKACEVIRETVAAQPVLPAAEIAPAAGSAAVDPVSTDADTSASVSPEDEPAGEQDAGDTDKASTDLPDTETAPPAGSAVVAPVSTAADTSAGVSSDDEPGAGNGVADPVLTGADTSAGVSSDDEPAGEQDAGSTAGDTDLFLLIATAPAAGTPVAEPVSSVVTSKRGQGNGGTDKSFILQTAKTAPTASIAAAPSVSSTSASTAAPQVEEPDTSQAESSSGKSSDTQSSDAQSTDAQSSDARSTDTQSKDDKKAAKEAAKDDKKAAKEDKKADKEAAKENGKEKGGKNKGHG